MKKIIITFGTRPEAIKMCPLAIELKKHKEFEVVLAVTGQHREMLKQVLDVFGVKPEYDLEIMLPGQSLFDITERAMLRMRDVLDKEKPDILLVHGDTTTAFACALAAFYSGIPVGHVEAGLRTYNIRSPYPEEFNRQAVDSISDYMFAPTQLSADNLIKEGKDESKIFVTGNTEIDALAYTVKQDYTHPELEWAKGSRLVVMTAHRRENLGAPMEQIFSAIKKVVDEHQDIKLIYAVHANPAVRRPAEKILGGEKRIHLIDPLAASDFHNFLAHSYLVLTDSGGIQEDAPSLGKPVIVLRDTTERPEGIDAGTLMLAGTSFDGVYSSFTKLLDDNELYDKMSKASNPYGDGHASERIAEILEKTL